MQIYLAIDDQKTGPFTLFHVEERLRSGEIPEDSLAWYEGLNEWKPLRELDPFESFFRLRDAEMEAQRRRRAAEKAVAYQQRQVETVPRTAVRPWTRFWARNLDFFFFLTACLLIFTSLRAFGWIKGSGSAGFMEIFPIFLPLWHVIEAYLIAHWGSTAGKVLLGIHITDLEGRTLRLGASLRRSLGVYVLGVGCYISGLSLIASLFGYYLLVKNRRTFWDNAAESQVHHAPFQARHVLIPIALVFLILTIFQGPFAEIANYQAEQMEKMRDAFGGETGDNTL